MRTLGVVTAVWLLVLLRDTQSQSLDELISEVFHKKSDTDNVATPAPPPPPETSTSRVIDEQEESDCECVPYYQCSDNGTIIDDGVGLIDIRLGSRSSHSKEPCSCTPGGIKDGPCSDYLDVCCKKPRTEHITPKPVERRGCGERHPDGVGFRITGDEDSEAQFGEFPWMIAVLRDTDEKKNVYQCGGALIHPKAVITAAHCVVGKRPSQMKIRAGEWDTQTKNELFPHQDRKVAHILAHREYYAGALYNDVALMILEEPVDMAENVDVICLPKKGTVFDKTRCVASGWGKDVFGKEGQYQVILKKVEVPVVPHQDCEEALRKTRLGIHFNLHESFICAGGERGKDTCKGDGGSPLVCPIKDDPLRYQQAGIVAWGIGCGGDVPGVYVNIPLFRDWIDEQLAKFELDISVYSY
ncbi:hypothetical protein R5R35_014113 [Gryllus longicercus]|uniref:Phenoloxidase-activating factor 2 n=1 Tax=Gryllus longicercus TaxID=2509291 RepID=A0AAN9V3D8_9ORTH